MLAFCSFSPQTSSSAKPNLIKCRVPHYGHPNQPCYRQRVLFKRLSNMSECTPRKRMCVCMYVCMYVRIFYYGHAPSRSPRKQGYGQCGSAALPASVIDMFCPLLGSSVNRHFATDLEGSKSFSLLNGKLPHYIFALTPRPLYEIEI